MRHPINYTLDADGNAVPVLWETMIFGGDHDGYQERYTSRADALTGHAVALDVVRGRVQP